MTRVLGTLGIIAAIVVLVCFGGIALFGAQQTQSTAGQSAAKLLPPATPVTAGQEMFQAYCASCHGLNGKGAGPAVSALKTPPPDLTQLTKRYGKFPAAMVESTIRGDDAVLSHGTRDMPIWGEAFRAVNADPNLAQMKVHNLRIYLESIQAPNQLRIQQK